MINERLKKTIENYSHELDNKNIILNQINVEKNQIENYLKKIDNDRQYIFTILIRICRIFANQNLNDLLNEIMNNKNLNINQKEKINIQVLNEIKSCELYFKILKGNEYKMNYIQKKNNLNNNNLFSNENKESLNYINYDNTPLMENIYLKKNLFVNEFKIDGINK